MCIDVVCYSINTRYQVPGIYINIGSGVLSGVPNFSQIQLFPNYQMYWEPY